MKCQCSRCFPDFAIQGSFSFLMNTTEMIVINKPFIKPISLKQIASSTFSLMSVHVRETIFVLSHPSAADLKDVQTARAHRALSLAVEDLYGAAQSKNVPDVVTVTSGHTWRILCGNVPHSFPREISQGITLFQRRRARETVLNKPLCLSFLISEVSMIIIVLLVAPHPLLSSSLK